MAMTRRDVIAGAGAAGLAAALPTVAQTAAKPKVELKLSSQEGIIPGRDLVERLDKMEKWGFAAIELGGNAGSRIDEVQKALKGRKIKISALCAGTPGGPIINEDPETRKKGVAAIKDLLEVAGVLGSTGVIIVPAFNGQTKLQHVEGRAILMDILKELGEHGAAHNSRVLLEPLNRNEAWFLRQLADAAEMCKETNSPGVAMMGDFYHMSHEEPSDEGAFISAGKWLHHVHLATSRKRILPGQEDWDYRGGFKGLKHIGYQDYCSFECGCKGDREVEIPKSMAFLREQWAKA